MLSGSARETDRVVDSGAQGIHQFDSGVGQTGDLLEGVGEVEGHRHALAAGYADRVYGVCGKTSAEGDDPDDSAGVVVGDGGQGEGSDQQKTQEDGLVFHFNFIDGNFQRAH